MKYILVGEKYSHNMGEPLLFKCTEYLVRKIAGDSTEIYSLDLFGRSNCTNDPTDTHINSSLKKLFKNAFRLCLRNSFVICNLNYKRILNGNIGQRIMKMYRDSLANDCKIIVMGAGTIKYDVRLDFGPYYQFLIEGVHAYAEKAPVFISCAGIESFYREHDARCKFFSRALSDPSIKYISTRDNLPELKKYVHNKNTVLEKVADIATYAADCFGIHKDENSQTIGIGIIIYRRFAEFHKGISREQYEGLILDIIHELELKEYKWVFFNNGDLEDAEYTKYICNRIGKDPVSHVLTPDSPEELVRIISRFKGIITSRLHSCITAYSLDIPFVALCWNNKLKYFAENIKVPERIIESDRFNIKDCMNEFYKALSDGYDTDFREEYKKSVYHSIEKIVAYDIND